MVVAFGRLLAMECASAFMPPRTRAPRDSRWFRFFGRNPKTHRDVSWTCRSPAWKGNAFIRDDMSCTVTEGTTASPSQRRAYVSQRLLSPSFIPTPIACTRFIQV